MREYVKAERIAVILEIIAALFISIQFLTTRKWHSDTDKRLLAILSRKIAPRGKLRTFVLILTSLLAFIVILGFIIWGATQDLKNPNVNILRLMSLNGLSFAGFILSIIVVFTSIRVVRKYKNINPVGFLVTMGFILGAISFFVPLFLHANVYILSFIIFFTAGILLTSLWLGAMPYLQKYLTFKSGVLIRFGIIIFIVAKIFQLFSMK